MTIDQLESLQKGTTTIRMLVKVTAQNGAVIRAALHSQNVVFESETYLSAPFTPSEFESLAGTGVSNMTFDVQLSTTLNRLNLKGGLWQGAQVEMIIIDVMRPQIGAIYRQRGRFGQVQIKGRQATLEYRSNTNLLAQEIGFKYSRHCRDELGGMFCTKNLSSFTFTGTVLSVTNEQKFTISVNQPDGYFYSGKVTLTSGENIGLSVGVQNNIGQTLILFKPIPGIVNVGDAFTIIAGCDKRIETCHTKFNNAINFFGEETIPEISKAFKIPE